MLLFLDFDGVLHPEGLRETEKDRLFCCAHLLHEILGAAPNVEVVFSTSWRYLFPRDVLIKKVTQGCPELANRFIGQTPYLEERDRPQGIIGQREDEIRKWLALNRQELRGWLALDDCRDIYWPNCQNLYLVDHQTGLVPEDVWTVVESLR